MVYCSPFFARNCIQQWGEMEATPSEKYGSVFTLHFGEERVVVLHGYEAIKEALTDHGDEFFGRGSLPLADKVLKGQGIVFSNGERWKQLRRFVLTTLRNLGMGKKSIEERIQMEAQHLLENIRSTGGNRDMHKLYFLLIHRIIELEGSSRLYSLFPSFMELIPGPHHRLEKNIYTLQQFTLDEINEHKSTFDPSAPQDIIDFFFIKMKEGQNDNTVFGFDNLIATVVDLFAAGTETTSTTLRYGLLILMKYPQVQEKMQEEIDRVVGRTRSPCMADRGQMPYTNAVAHEIQRFIALIPMSLPHAVVKDTKFREYIIPKGTTIYVSLSSVLHDSTEFPNPKEFDPHHFLNKDGSFRKSNYFMPFSAGKRLCAGEGMARMELFLFWTTILQNFTLKPLVDPKTLDITPQFSGLGNVPKPYQLCALPR
uniref:unspecific monooxygenase n=1 Tax=Salvator merianae TaxID=96440 RepID=A0A8D0BGR4_SALMN